MHLATSTGYGPYLLFWVPPLLIVACVGLFSATKQKRPGRQADTLWKWQRWTLIFTAVLGIAIHCAGLIQLRSVPEAARAIDPRWREDGLEVIAFVDYGFLVILGFAIILWFIAYIARTTAKEAQQVVSGNAVPPAP